MTYLLKHTATYCNTIARAVRGGGTGEGSTTKESGVGDKESKKDWALEEEEEAEMDEHAGQGRRAAGGARGEGGAES